MSTPILLPELGTGDQPIRISCWLVALGESVESSDRLVEVYIPGVTFDVPAPAAGRLTRIEKPEDSIVVTGDVLGWIG